MADRDRIASISESFTDFSTWLAEVKTKLEVNAFQFTHHTSTSLPVTFLALIRGQNKMILKEVSEEIDSNEALDRLGKLAPQVQVGDKIMMIVN